jgi:hypothetical protein
MTDSNIVWTGEWSGDDEGLRELQPFVEQHADGTFFGGFDFSYRGGKPRRCYEPELFSDLAAARTAAKTAVQNWLRARVEREAVHEIRQPGVEAVVIAPTPTRGVAASLGSGPAAVHQHVAGPGVAGHAPAQAGELTTYWLYHEGEFVGAKRMPVGTKPDAVRSAARDDATVTCDRLKGETPHVREMRIMNSAVRVYDDRPAQERARRDLPFEMRGLFPKELPFFELTFRSNRTGYGRAEHLAALSVDLQQIACRDALGMTCVAGESGLPYERLARVEFSDTVALGRCEAAMKAALAASGAVLVGEFGVGYVRIEAPVADEERADSRAAILFEPQVPDEDEPQVDRPSI